MVGALVLMVVAPAYAQVCQEPTGNIGGKVNLTCDMNYRNQVVACDKVNPANTKEILGTRPSCPAKPMPMIDTPKKSYIADYSPYLWQYPRDETDPTRPYAGTFSLGTPGDASRTFQLFGNTSPGAKRLASCTTQIKLPSDPTTDEDWAKLTRLQADNCANQYILNSAIYPVQKENSQILSGDDPAKPGDKVSLASECQPLNTFSADNEYNVSTYLQAAWQKTLQDASYRKTTPDVLKCVPCVSSDIPCDREPHLPCAGPGNQGLTLENPLKFPNELKTPPQPFPEVLLSSISTVKYEDIIDPTHPFSPRWDYLLNDRDYANLSASSLGSFSPTALAIQVALNVYMTTTKNAVFCAGVKNSQESDAKKKNDDEVKVDVLEFRKKAFEDSLTKRATYNSVCYSPLGHDPRGGAIDALFFVAPTSWCYNITGFSIWYPWIYARGKDCWQCFGLNGKVDDESQHPPCTTTYIGKDLRIKNSFPGGFNAFKRDANCGTKFDKICRDLRKPYTQMNKLKMRYHNPDDEDDKNGDNVVLKDGALEGMAFKEYFGNHMPYPKLWDTGQPLLRMPNNDKNNQPPLDTTGQYTAIVGVGHEAAAQAASDLSPADADGKQPADKYTDQRCKTMGWGGTLGPLPVTFGGVNITLPDPVTSWTEMKLYETRTMRNVGLSCIARYEKVFKPGSAENMMMMVAGGEWQKMIISQCTRLPQGRTQNCKFMTIKEYTDAGNPADDTSTVYLKQMEPDADPLAWRGYLSAKDTAVKFPSFGGTAPSGANISGLDNAQQGDIVLLPNGPGDNAAKPGLAKLAFVIGTHLDKDKTDCEAKKGCYIRVLEPDDGKWPDICGSTDTWGEMKSRYYFKPGHLPDEATKEYARIKSTGNCEETKLSHCEQTGWSNLKLYRITKDVRKGCVNKDSAANCEKDE